MAQLKDASPFHHKRTKRNHVYVKQVFRLRWEPILSSSTEIVGTFGFYSTVEFGN